MAKFAMVLVLFAASAATASASDCAGGRCAVRQPARTAVRTTVRTSERVVTAPGRLVRRAFGR